MGTYLGQNFLTDSKVRSYIASKVGDLYKKLDCNALIEIGPGKGAITKLINQISDNFMVIEKDNTLKEKILAIGNDKGGIINYIQGDVLEVDVAKILKEKKLKYERTLVVGNLPYYITSPILRKFFADGNPNFPGGIFMLQNEVGEKIRFDAKKKSYLRWLLNYGYDVTYLKMVPAKAFSPAPKVKSCLVELRIKNLDYKIEWNRLIEFLDLYSGFSRKTLGAIEKILIKQNKNKFQINDNLHQKRMEELTWENIGEIIN
ncbi:MAG: rRNA adenine dimethyltransferase family protein [Candidatus Absconditicoccaceae bacterium]